MVGNSQHSVLDSAIYGSLSLDCPRVNLNRIHAYYSTESGLSRTQIDFKMYHGSIRLTTITILDSVSTRLNAAARIVFEPNRVADGTC